MKKNFQNQLISNFIQSTMTAVNLLLEIQEETSGINMSYNFVTNRIGVDYMRVQEALNELPYPVSLEEYIKVFTLHELGHAMDRKALMDSLPRTVEIFDMKNAHSLYEIYNNEELLPMMIEEHEMNIHFEQTAWKNAALLNQQYALVDWDIFERLKAHSLSTYTDLLERDLNLYQSLLEEENYADIA